MLKLNCRDINIILIGSKQIFRILDTLSTWNITLRRIIIKAEAEYILYFLYIYNNDGSLTEINQLDVMMASSFVWWLVALSFLIN